MNSESQRRCGTCLCGENRFEVAGHIKGIGQCHCSKCRKVSGTGGNAVFLVPVPRFRWLSEDVKRKQFQLQSGWRTCRCTECGSPLPESHDGKRFWVQAGLMDEPLNTKIKTHIFCGSRADWDQEANDARHFDEMMLS